MNRRGFLRLLGGAVAAAVAPTKTYAFFGEILRPKLQTEGLTLDCIAALMGEERYIEPQNVGHIYLNRKTYAMLMEMVKENARGQA